MCAIVSHAVKQVIFEHSHLSAATGNFGVQNIIDKINQRFDSNNFAKEVHNWCMKYPNFNQHKTIKTTLAFMQAMYINKPFTKIAIDLIKLLPKTECGNRYILTVIDYFTIYVEAHPLQKQNTGSIAKVILNEIVSRYGVPYIIHTDQGANFESNKYNKIYKLINIANERSSQYHSQCDNQVERIICTIFTPL